MKSFEEEFAPELARLAAGAVERKRILSECIAVHEELRDRPYTTPLSLLRRLWRRLTT